MHIKEMNWMGVEARVREDDRAVLPIGSTEQHAYLSLMVDAILAEKVSIEAAQPLGVPVFPVQPYGMTPYFADFPGTVSLQPSTYFALIADILDSIHRSGFRRILIVNGHGGNSPVQAAILEWLNRHPDARVKFHNWWAAPKTMGRVREIDPIATHASWMENFPWTRLAGVALPREKKAMIDAARLQQMNARAARAYLGDGNYGGDYQKDDAAMADIWAVAVTETRALLEEGWA